LATWVIYMGHAWATFLSLPVISVFPFRKIRMNGRILLAQTFTAVEYITRGVPCRACLFIYTGHVCYTICQNLECIFIYIHAYSRSIHGGACITFFFSHFHLFSLSQYNDAMKKYLEFVLLEKRVRQRTKSSGGHRLHRVRWRMFCRMSPWGGPRGGER
jgi:hypothetical protein